jgi:hypothetical protein
LGPVLGASVRLAVVTLGGVALLHAEAAPWTYFALVAAAMVAYGLFNASALALTDWNKSAAVARATPRENPAP